MNSLSSSLREVMFERSQSLNFSQEMSLEKNLDSAMGQTCALMLQTENIMYPYQNHRVVSEKLEQLLQALKDLHGHLIFIYGLVNATSYEEIMKVKMENVQLAHLYDAVNLPEDISRASLKDGICFYENILLSEVSDVLTGCMYRQNNREIVINRVDKRVADLNKLAGRLDNVRANLPSLIVFDQEDLFSQDRSSDNWKQLYKLAKFKDFSSKEEIQETLKNPCLSFTNEPQSSSVRSLDDERGRLRTFFQNVMQENAWMRSIMRVNLPNTAFDKIIYIDRKFPEITRQVLEEEYDDLQFLQLMDIEVPKLTSQEKTSENLLQVKPNGVKMRIISSEPLIFQCSKAEKFKIFARKAGKLFNFYRRENFSERLEGIVIYVHGGGFVSPSTNTHQNYLLRWAHTLNKIIFSIDYRQAPEHPYPAALDDIWQAYLWIRSYSESVLGISTQKIILVGDYSGANLILALCLRLIKVGQPPPQGCVLIRPLVNLNDQRFAPSRIWIGNSPYRNLKVPAYTADRFDPKIDPFLSPILASETFLVGFPPIRILVGANDPFYDEVWRFVERLRQVLYIKMGDNLKKHLSLTIFKDLPDGFLQSEELRNYDSLLGSVCELIQQLFYLDNYS